ncbi:hypothetical protein FQA39_LY18864 [Lamprigera yunnana]|nr:hypothetical protein FQA39_LY18864 [Lamprigera yunnana]
MIWRGEIRWRRGKRPMRCRDARQAEGVVGSMGAAGPTAAPDHRARSPTEARRGGRVVAAASLHAPRAKDGSSSPLAHRDEEVRRIGLFFGDLDGACAAAIDLAEHPPQACTSDAFNGPERSWGTSAHRDALDGLEKTLNARTPPRGLRTVTDRSQSMAGSSSPTARNPVAEHHVVSHGTVPSSISDAVCKHRLITARPPASTSGPAEVGEVGSHGVRTFQHVEVRTPPRAASPGRLRRAPSPGRIEKSTLRHHPDRRALRNVRCPAILASSALPNCTPWHGSDHTMPLPASRSAFVIPLCALWYDRASENVDSPRCPELWLAEEPGGGDEVSGVAQLSARDPPSRTTVTPIAAAAASHGPPCT